MTINRVYEDMLPGDRFGFTLKSLFERRQLTNFIRNMIFSENGSRGAWSASGLATPIPNKTLFRFSPPIVYIKLDVP